MLSFAALFSLVAVPVLAIGRFPLKGGYFSGLFALALCPCLLTSLNVVLRVRHFLEVEVQDDRPPELVAKPDQAVPYPTHS